MRVLLQEWAGGGAFVRGGLSREPSFQMGLQVPKCDLPTGRSRYFCGPKPRAAVPLTAQGASIRPVGVFVLCRAQACRTGAGEQAPRWDSCWVLLVPHAPKKLASQVIGQLTSASAVASVHQKPRD